MHPLLSLQDYVKNAVIREAENYKLPEGLRIMKLFATRFPNADELLQPCTEEYWKTYTDTVENKKVDVYTISDYDPLEQV